MSEDNGVQIIENTEEAKDAYHNMYWGRGDIVLTSEQVSALLAGKCLIWNDGEYSHSICVQSKIDPNKLICK